MLARALACALVALIWTRAARAGEVVLLPLRVHVPFVNDAPVVSIEFIVERVKRANKIFAPYGVSFMIAKTSVIAAEHAALETRADRDALSAYTERGSIDCFVVGSLRDVDDPSELRRGVHWRSQTHDGRHYVIISSIAGTDVLAHELGHYLGNPAHSDTPGNLLSYTPAEGLPFLDQKQQRRLGRTLREYLKSGELGALPN